MNLFLNKFLVQLTYLTFLTLICHRLNAQNTSKYTRGERVWCCQKLLLHAFIQVYTTTTRELRNRNAGPSFSVVDVHLRFRLLWWPYDADSYPYCSAPIEKVKSLDLINHNVMIFKPSAVFQVGYNEFKKHIWLRCLTHFHEMGLTGSWARV